MFSPKELCARPAQDAAQPQATRARFTQKCPRARSACARKRKVRKDASQTRQWDSRTLHRNFRDAPQVLHNKLRRGLADVSKGFTDVSQMLHRCFTNVSMGFTNVSQTLHRCFERAQIEKPKVRFFEIPACSRGTKLKNQRPFFLKCHLCRNSPRARSRSICARPAQGRAQGWATEQNQAIGSAAEQSEHSTSLAIEQTITIGGSMNC